VDDALVHVGGRKTRRVVLRAVDVPGLDLERDGALVPCLIAGMVELRDQVRVVLNHPRATPDRDAPPVGVVHQVDEGAWVVREFAVGDVLLVAAEIRKGQRARADGLEKPGRTTPVLDIRLALGVGRGEVGGITLCQEGAQVVRDRVAPAVLLLHVGVAPAAAAPLLGHLYRWCEGDVADELPHRSSSHELVLPHSLSAGAALQTP
jgi:hypothetical protein